jgi:sulfoxide reductase heme-binding subunit YedZ
VSTPLAASEHQKELGIIPLLFAVKWSYQSRLGANPVEFLEHYTGDWTLRLLLTTLTMTPLRMLTRLTEPVRVRRILGLWAFAFLCLHFSIYLVFDLGFSVLQLGEDGRRRRGIARHGTLCPHLRDISDAIRKLRLASS